MGGGGGHDGPQNVLATVLKLLENQKSSPSQMGLQVGYQKVIFGSLSYLVLP